MNLLTRRTVDSLRTNPDTPSEKPILVQTVSDETSPAADTDLIHRKRKNVEQVPLQQKRLRSADKATTIQPPEVLSEKMPPLDHLIQASPSAW